MLQRKVISNLIIGLTVVIIVFILEVAMAWIIMDLLPTVLLKAIWTTAYGYFVVMVVRPHMVAYLRKQYPLHQ